MQVLVTTRVASPDYGRCYISIPLIGRLACRCDEVNEFIGKANTRSTMMPGTDAVALLIQLSITALLGATARNLWQTAAVVAGLVVAGLLYDSATGAVHSVTDDVFSAVTWLAAAGFGHMLRRIIE